MKYSALLALFCLWHIGCYSTRPTYTTRTADRSGVEVYTEPRYESGVNWFGWTVVLGATAGSAYGGYVSGVELEWETGAPREEKPVANAVLAGLVGGVTMLLLVESFKPDAPSRSELNEAEWVRDLDERLIYTGPGNFDAGSITAIRDTGDRSFVPRTRFDLERFLTAFPDSPERERVALEAGTRFPLEELPVVLRLFPGTEGAEVAGGRLIDKASSLTALAKLAESSPELRDPAAARAAALVKTRTDAVQFARSFSGSPMLMTAVENALPNTGRYETGLMMEDLTGDSVQALLRRAYLGKSTTVAEVIDAAEKFPELRGECERKGASLAVTATDCRRYLAAFPDGEGAERIRTKLKTAARIPENLGITVNTSASEYSPVISPDGKTLYFTRSFTRENMGTFDDDDIWLSTLNANGDWSTAKNLSALNNRSPNSVNSVTPDGNTLLVHGEYTGLRWTTAASLTHRTATGWSAPEPLRIDGYYNLGSYMQSFLGNDGRTLLLALERREGEGEHDLYVSFLQSDGTWSKPKNLGRTINTTGRDDSPFLASDGRTLYFSSNGHGGEGGQDIFMSRRLDDSWTKWSRPENLGTPINTEEDDDFFFLPASGDVAYYSSTKSGHGFSDIFRVALPEGVQPLPVVLVAGRVLESGTGAPVEARVVYEDLATGKEIGVARTDPATGAYKIALPPGSAYGFRAEAPGYIAVNDNLDLSELKVYREQTRDLALVPIRAGEVVRVNNLFFDPGMAVLRPESYPELNRLSGLLKERKTMAIEIQGHTDSIGTDEHNLRLSQERAAAVATYLAGRGTDRSRLTVTGFGETRPIGTNGTDDGRRLNRRVEIVIRRE